jgi:hypothetical protein
MAPPEDCSRDAEAVSICQRLAGELFPWDITRALELALLKTFCVPSIAGLLDRTGEFERRPRKRYDDTGLMVAEMLRHGPDSPQGAAVIMRMNRIHSHYAIRNDDYLYVLSTFVAEPIRWLERFGWRPLSAEEQQALFRFWRRVGTRMAIETIPATLEELLAFHQRFEAERFAAAPANGRVADATLAMLLRDWPAPLRPAIRRLLQGLPEAGVCTSLGWPQAPPALQRTLRAALRQRLAAAAPAARHPLLFGRAHPQLRHLLPAGAAGATTAAEAAQPAPLERPAAAHRPHRRHRQRQEHRGPAAGGARTARARCRPLRPRGPHPRK